MRGFRLFERPVGAFTTLPLLQVVGDLASYQAGAPYTGRLDILGAVGRCHVEIVEEDSYLPPGSYAYVDNFSQQVVLKWPAYHPPAPTDDEIINPDFQAGMDGWHDLRGNSWEVRKYEDDDTNVGPGDRPRPPGNLAAWMTGAGRGDHILESIQYPVEPGQYITARSLWDQGPSNKDNNNLFTALGLYRDGSFIEEVLGDRIHDRSNRTRHWSEVDHLIQPGIDAVTIRLIAHRRNGRNREIIVDNVETSGLRYATGTDDQHETYFVKFKVTDSANRVAYWSGHISVQTSTVYALIRSGTIGTTHTWVSRLYKSEDDFATVTDLNQPWTSYAQSPAMYVRIVGDRAVLSTKGASPRSVHIGPVDGSAPPEVYSVAAGTLDQGFITTHDGWLYRCAGNDSAIQRKLLSDTSPFVSAGLGNGGCVSFLGNGDIVKFPGGGNGLRGSRSTDGGMSFSNLTYPSSWFVSWNSHGPYTLDFYESCLIAVGRYSGSINTGNRPAIIRVVGSALSVAYTFPAVPEDHSGTGCALGFLPLLNRVVAFCTLGRVATNDSEGAAGAWDYRGQILDPNPTPDLNFPAIIVQQTDQGLLIAYHRDRIYYTEDGVSFQRLGNLPSTGDGSMLDFVALVE